MIGLGSDKISKSINVLELLTCRFSRKLAEEKQLSGEVYKNILTLNLIEQCTSILEIISPQVEERGNSLDDLRLFAIRCKT